MAKKTAESEMEPEPKITLDEFCLGVSQRDKRVELIAGFHAEQRARGVVKAAPSEFRAALEAFATRPA